VGWWVGGLVGWWVGGLVGGMSLGYLKEKAVCMIDLAMSGK
jgi:hypothetical protein